MRRSRTLSVLATFAMVSTLVVALPAAADVVTYVVDSTADAPDANPGDDVCATAAGECTLRAALQDSAADPARLGTVDTITVPAGLYRIASELVVDSSVVIEGAGMGSTVIDAATTVFDPLATPRWSVPDPNPDDDPATDHRVLRAAGGTETSTLRGLTLRGGYARQGGGAAAWGFGSLVLEDVEVYGNSSGDPSIGGGGIGFTGTDLTISGSRFIGNTAEFRGGAIDARSADSVTISNSVFDGNGGQVPAGVTTDNLATAFRVDDGGAVHVDGVDVTTPVTISSSIFRDNIAGTGGAVRITDADLTVTASRFERNDAGRSGGGIAVDETVPGTTTTLVEDSEFTDNVAAGRTDGGNPTGGSGGGLATRSTATVRDSEFTGNYAARGGGIEHRSTQQLVVERSSFQRNDGFFQGAGLAVESSSRTTVRNTSLVANVAGGNGGGAVYARTDDSGTITGTQPVELIHTTIADNEGVPGAQLLATGPDGIELLNSVVDFGVVGVDQCQNVVSRGGNLLTNSTDCPVVAAAGDVVDAGPTLNRGLSADGPVAVSDSVLGLPLLPSVSPAVAEVPCAVTDDARGLLRDLAGTCTTGALERGFLVDDAGTATGPIDGVCEPCTLAEAFAEIDALALRTAVEIVTPAGDPLLVPPTGLTLTGGRVVLHSNVGTDLVELPPAPKPTITTGGGAAPVFTVELGAQLQVANLSLEGSAGTPAAGGIVLARGFFDARDTDLLFGQATTGGAIASESGIVSLRGGSVSDNLAQFGGGVALEGGSLFVAREVDFAGNQAGTEGGAIFHAAGAGSSMTVESSFFGANGASTGNAGPFPAAANGFGGAISLNSGFARLTGVEFSDNRAGQDGVTSGIGGAVRAREATVIVEPGTYTNADTLTGGFFTNVATGLGGTLSIDGDPGSTARMTITGVDVSGGEADVDLGGDGDGGAIAHRGDAELHVVRSTFQANSAVNGGAIRSLTGAGDLVVAESRFAGNTATTNGGAVAMVDARLGGWFGTTTIANDAGVLGGGLFLDASTAVPGDVADSDFTGNTSGSDGGGIYSSATNLVLERVLLDGNDAGTGDGGGGLLSGATFLRDSKVNGNDAANGAGVAARFIVVDDTTFSNNTATTRGGGLALLAGVDASSPTVRDSQFLGNSAQLGGGISTSRGNTTLLRLELDGNTATGSGGGLHTDTTGTTLTDSVLVRNDAVGDGSAVLAGNGATLDVTGTDIFQNGPAAVTVVAYAGATGTIARSSVRDNTHLGNGAVRSSLGGGDLTIENSSVFGNTGTVNAFGGVVQNDGLLVVRASTIVQNTGVVGGVPVQRNLLFTTAGAAGTPVRVQSSIIGANEGLDGAGGNGCFSTGLGTNGTVEGPSLVESDVAACIADLETPDDALPQDLVLAAAGTSYEPSPAAIDRVDPAATAPDGTALCPATDQLGTARPQGAACDLGAIESTDVVAAPNVDVAVSVDQASVAPGVSTVASADLDTTTVDATSTDTDGEGPVAADVLDAPIRQVPIRQVPIRQVQLEEAPIRQVGDGPDPVRQELGATTLNEIPLTDDDPDDGVPPLIVAGVGYDSWDQLLNAGTATEPLLPDLFGRPTHAVSLVELLDAAEALGGAAGASISAVPIRQVELLDTTLGALPLGVLPIRQVDVGDLPWAELLEGVTAGTSDLQAFCDWFGEESSYDCTEMGIDPSTTGETGVDVLDATIAGAPIRQVPIRQVDLRDIPIRQVPIRQVPIRQVQLAGTPIRQVPIRQVPIRQVDVDAATAADPLFEELQVPYDAGSGPVATPIRQVPIRQVAPDGTLEANPIRQVPISELAPDGTPIRQVPIRQVGEIADLPIRQVDAAGTPIRQVPIRQVLLLNVAPDGTPIRQVGPDGTPIRQVALADVPIRQVVLDVPSVAAIPLAELDPATRDALFTCGSACAFTGTTIGDEAALLRADATFGELGVYPGVTLGDLLAAYHIGMTLGELVDVLLGPDAVGDFSAEVDAVFDTLLLGDLAGYGDLTIGDLLDFFGPVFLDALIYALVAFPDGPDLTLLDLLLTILPPDELPFEDVDLGNGGIQYSDPDAQYVELTVDLTGTDLPPGTVATVTVDLPGAAVVAPDGGLVATGPLGTTPPSGGDATPFTGSPTAPVFRVPLTNGETALRIPVAAPLAIGTQTATTTVEVAPLGTVDEVETSFTVVEEFEPNDTLDDIGFDAALAPTGVDPDRTGLAAGNLYLSHVATPDDVDLYTVELPEGASLSLYLGNVPEGEDFDLRLYGPAGTRPDGLPGDSGSTDDSVEQDVHVVDGLPIVATSALSGTESERIDVQAVRAAGTYVVQVTGSNGSWSPDPYTLRARVFAAPDLECVAREGYDDPAPAPSVALPGVTADTGTLFLLHRDRYAAAHGDAALAALESSLAAVVGFDDGTGLSVDGAVVDLGGDADVQAAYDDWDTALGRCLPESANAVVEEVRDLVEDLRATTPGIEHVVLVGTDEQIPFARIPDLTELANERTYASTFAGDQPDDELVASFAFGYYLSDNPYADPTPSLSDGREVYVPELGLGRLVETHQQIVDQLDQFVTFGGRLDAATTRSEFVTAYDFLADGGEAVADALGTPAADRLISEEGELDQWTSQDLRDELGLRVGLDVASLNAHYDHYRLLSAAEDANGTQADLFEATELGADYAGTISFTMGCHSGLSVSNVSVGNGVTGDWAETWADRGAAAYVANTGFGYGDTEVVAYSEQLMTDFAAYLDGSTSIGLAMAFAKSAYVGGWTELFEYHEKVVQEATFYGLPMFLVGDAPPAPPVVQENLPGTDGATGQPASTELFDADPLAGTGFERVDGDRGSYFTVGDGEGGTFRPQVTNGQPLQPRWERDVTAITGDGEVVGRARGVVIESITERTPIELDPVIATATVDSGAKEPELRTEGTTFPSSFARVSRTETPYGPRDRVQFVPGTFTGDWDGGTQRLFDDAELTVYYDDGSGDVTPPRIVRTDAVTTGATTAFTSFEVETSDDVAVTRVQVLYREPDSTVWRAVDLARTAGTPGDREDPELWTGGVQLTTPTSDPIEYLVHAVDGSGLVGVTTDKAAFHEAPVVLAPVVEPEDDGDPATPGAIVVTPVTGVLDASGWYTGAVEVTVVGDADQDAELFVDGVLVARAADGPVSVTLGDTGTSRLELEDEGATDLRIVRIDVTAPTLTFTSPPDGTTYRTGAVVPVAVAAADAGAGIDPGTLAVPATPLGTSTPGVFTLDAAVTDLVGNGPTTASTTYRVLGLRSPTAVLDGGSFTLEVAGLLDGDEVVVDWGDGFLTELSALPPEGPDGYRSFSHTYLSPGRYAPTVRVVGSNAVAADEVSVLTLVADPTTVQIGTPVLLHVGGLEGGEDVTLLWNDGSVDEFTAGSLPPLQPDGTRRFEHTYTTPGMYRVGVRVDGGTTVEFLYVVAYDPTKNHVTSSGTFASPAGAVADDPAATGTASYAFNALYNERKRDTVASSSFEFSLAGLEFASTSYEYILVLDPDGSDAEVAKVARMGGTGTLGGEEGYGFLIVGQERLTVDGDLPDAIRIVLYEETATGGIGRIVYDSLPGTALDAQDATVLTAGDLKIHEAAGDGGGAGGKKR